MKLELKKIDYWPLIKVSFLINLIGGFIMGLFFALFMGMMSGLAQSMGGLPGFPELMEEEMPPFGFMLIIYPIFFSLMAAFFYTLICVIMAFIYNIIAKLAGGLEIEFDEVHIRPVAYQPSPPTAQASAPAYGPPQPPQPPTPAQPMPPPPVQPLPPDITPPEEDEGSDDYKV